MDISRVAVPRAPRLAGVARDLEALAVCAAIGVGVWFGGVALLADQSFGPDDAPVGAEQRVTGSLDLGDLDFFDLDFFDLDLPTDGPARDGPADSSLPSTELSVMPSGAA